MVEEAGSDTPDRGPAQYHGCDACARQQEPLCAWPRGSGSDAGIRSTGGKARAVSRRPAGFAACGVSGPAVDGVHGISERAFVEEPSGWQRGGTADERARLHATVVAGWQMDSLF